MNDAKVVPTGNAAPAGGDGKAPADPKATRKVGNKKDFFLRSAKTEPYADDTELYTPKITRHDRLEYYDKMQAQKVRRIPAPGHFSYLESVKAADPDAAKFPISAKILLQIVKTNAWDYTYLILFMIWLLLLVVVYDKISIGLPVDLLYTTTYATTIVFPNVSMPSIPSLSANSSMPSQPAPTQWPTPQGNSTTTETIVLSQYMAAPLLLMFLLQCIPTFGTIYLMVRCNDLVRYTAKLRLGNWAFCSVLVAQCVEFWFYGGRGREHLAGKCKIQNSIFANFTLRAVKTHIGIETDISKREVDEEVSDDDNPALVEDSSDEEMVTKIEKAFVEKAREAEEKGEEPPQRPKEEISVLQQLNEQRAADEAERRRLIEEARIASEANCRDWTEWTCLVCNRFNRRPTRPIRTVDVRFGEKGAYYKRTYAIIVQSANSPQCMHCLTLANYQPPKSSAHTFSYNKQPHIAFSNYPISSVVNSGLSTRRIDIWRNSLRSFLFGIFNDVKSKMVFNDWRLRVYVNAIFPEVPRQVKAADELYEIGEMVECKVQKSDWARAVVIAARENHTYDIRYDLGNEVRLLQEGELRLPPEKRAYAYRVEMMTVVLVVTFPLGMALATLGSPTAVFIGPLLVAVVLLPIRIYTTIKMMRKRHHAGISPTFRIALFFTLPVLLLLIASVVPFLGSTSWTTVAVLFILVKVSSALVLYVQKPNFAMFGLAVFAQTSAGMFLTALYWDGSPVSKYLFVALAPLFTACLTMLSFRRSLHLVWDVHLKIRPPVNHIVDKRSMMTKLGDMVGIDL